MKQYCHLLSLLSLLLFSTLLHSQTGKLRILTSYDLEVGTLQLFQADSLIDQYQFSSYNDEYLKTIEVGEYKLVFSIKDSSKQILENVLIKENTITTAYFYPLEWHSRSRKDTLVKWKIINSLHYLNGNNFINNNKTFGSYFDFGFKQGELHSHSKYLSSGYQIGSSMSYTYFNKDHSLSTTNIDFDNERYYYWDLNFTLLSRLTAYNNQNRKKKGIFLDLGASYNFPLLFRHVISDGNTKTITKRIHDYTDFSAMARLGYSYFALTVDYRLMDFLEQGFPEQPKIKVGLSLLFLDSRR